MRRNMKRSGDEAGNKPKENQNTRKSNPVKQGKQLTGLDVLRQMKLEDVKRKYPNIPYPVVTKYSDKTANGLTRCIIDFIRLSGGQAERIACTGRVIDRRQRVTDCLGFSRQIGSIQRIPASMQPGTADISATYKGQSIKIEVKVGRDRQSSAQIAYQGQVEAAGGIYLIARDFESFYQWYLKKFPE